MSERLTAAKVWEDMKRRAPHEQPPHLRAALAAALGAGLPGGQCPDCDGQPECAGEQPVKTPPITICNSSSRLAYTAGNATAAPARERADNALAIPSRVGNRLHYRCGRVADLGGNLCCEA